MEKPGPCHGQALQQEVADLRWQREVRKTQLQEWVRFSNLTLKRRHSGLASYARGNQSTRGATILKQRAKLGFRILYGTYQ